MSGHTGTLYVVGTPIGNLEDVTLRALRVLRDADVIAAEDTRHARILLDRYAITTPVVSYHEHVERQRAPRLVARLRRGESVALISDAGMPGLSDPGQVLIEEAIAAGIPVVPVPGPTALVAGLVASGLPTDRFTFLGFLPRRSGERTRALSRLRDESGTLVFYEAPNRLATTLRELRASLGDRRCAVARELTKMHEEMFRGTLSEAERHFGRVVRGEVTIVVEGRREPVRVSEAEIAQALRTLLAGGVPPAEAIRRVAASTGAARNVVYRVALQLTR